MKIYYKASRKILPKEDTHLLNIPPAYKLKTIPHTKGVLTYEVSERVLNYEIKYDYKG